MINLPPLGCRTLRLRTFWLVRQATFLKNVYRQPQTNRKIQLTSPALALGQAVHQVLESLSTMETSQRFATSLLSKYHQAWSKLTGQRGGFASQEQEEKYRQRGQVMLEQVMAHPGPLLNLAVKIKQDLPYFWLSETDQIILCGKIDWLEYLPDQDAVHIIDFKTGRGQERDSSQQLPIYRLLAEHCQSKPVVKASYWYLELGDELSPQPLPVASTAHQEILTLAKKIKLARSLNLFKCPQGESGCLVCRPLEKVIKGQAQLVGLNDFGQEVYILSGNQETETVPQEEIL